MRSKDLTKLMDRHYVLLVYDVVHETRKMLENLPEQRDASGRVLDAATDAVLGASVDLERAETLLMLVAAGLLVNGANTAITDGSGASAYAVGEG